MTKYFLKNAFSTLDIHENSFIINHNSRNILDPIDTATGMYKYQNTMLVKKESRQSK